MKQKLLFALVAFLLMSVTPVRADIITYRWDDDFTSSTFAGQFRVDTNRLLSYGGPGMLLTQDAIIDSFFQYSRFTLTGQPVFLTASQVAPGGIAINPLTGAVLFDGGQILFGPSTIIPVGQPMAGAQVFSARADLDTRYNVSYGPGVGGAQSVRGRDTSRPDEYLFSSGHWEVSIEPTSPVPAPPAVVLLILGLGALVGTRGRRMVK